MYNPIKIEIAPQWVHQITQEYLPKFNQLKGKANCISQQTKLSEEIIALLKHRKQQLGLSTQSMKKPFEYIERLLEVNGHQLLTSSSTEESDVIGDAKSRQQQNQLNQTIEQLESDQDRIDKLEQRVSQLEAMLQQQHSRTEPRTVKITPKRETKNWDCISTDELFGLGKYQKPARGKGSAEEKIKRSVEAVIKWNDQFPPQANPEKKVVPNTQLIRSISGSNAQLIRKWIDANQHYILEHINKHSLSKDGQPDNYHNSRYKPEPHRNPKMLMELIA